MIGVGRYALNVHDIPSLNMKMKSLIQRTPIHQQLKADVDRDESTAFTEWDALWEEGRQADAERAEMKRLRKEARSKS